MPKPYWLRCSTSCVQMCIFEHIGWHLMVSLRRIANRRNTSNKVDLFSWLDKSWPSDQLVIDVPLMSEASCDPEIHCLLGRKSWNLDLDGVSPTTTMLEVWVFQGGLCQKMVYSLISLQHNRWKDKQLEMVDSDKRILTYWHSSKVGIPRSSQQMGSSTDATLLSVSAWNWKGT